MNGGLRIASLAEFASLQVLVRVVQPPIYRNGVRAFTDEQDHLQDWTKPKNLVWQGVGKRLV